MRLISLKNIEPGMRLARTVFSDSGRILLREGVDMRETYIKSLEKYNIFNVYIEDDISKDINVIDVIDEKTRSQAKSLVKTTMDDLKVKKYRNTDIVKKVVDSIIDDLLLNRNVLVNLNDIKSADDYTFSHSVNVCVLSVIVGIKLGLDQLKLKSLALGALLHDVGKVSIPEEILKKPGKLTPEEFEQVKLHTTLGHEMLRANREIPPTASYVAIAHHERYDGSGYPRGIKGDEIHIFARIVAIADVYDALTSDRIYRARLKNHEAIEYISTLGKSCFDNVILECFIKSVALYPVGTGVLLDTGEKGIVVDINKTFPNRPIVRIVFDAKGHKLPNFIELDLTKKLNVFIADSCDL